MIGVTVEERLTFFTFGPSELHKHIFLFFLCNSPKKEGSWFCEAAVPVNGDPENGASIDPHRRYRPRSKLTCLVLVTYLWL